MILKAWNFYLHPCFFFIITCLSHYPAIIWLTASLPTHHSWQDPYNGCLINSQGSTCSLCQNVRRTSTFWTALFRNLKSYITSYLTNFFFLSTVIIHCNSMLEMDKTYIGAILTSQGHCNQIQVTSTKIGISETFQITILHHFINKRIKIFIFLNGTVITLCNL
jgi:hypothetical protein